SQLLHPPSEPRRLARHSHLLVERQAGVRRVLESIFLRAVDRHVVVAAHAGIDEFDHYFLTYTFKVTIAPGFKRECGCLAAAFFHWALVRSAGGMRIDFVRRTVHDVHTAAIGLPARNASSKMLVGVGYAPVVLFLVFVLFRIRSGVAALPESFNEIIALFIVGKLLECGSFLVGDNPDYVLVQPLLVSLAKLNVQGSFLRLLLFLVRFALERIGIVGRLGLGVGRGYRG